MSAHLLTSGIIHSVTDPYATSLLAADGVIAWLGSDESAGRVAGAEVPRVDLDGAVVAPGFVAPVGTWADAPDALRRGVTVLTVLEGWGADPDGRPRPEACRGLQTVLYRPGAADEDRPAGDEDARAAGVWLAADGAADAGLAARLMAATRRGEQAYLVPSRPGLPEEEALAAQAGALSALRSAADELGSAALGRVRHRVLLSGPVDARDRALLAATATSVTVLAGAERGMGAALGTLLADAVPVALGVTGQANPWAGVRAALAHPEEAERISARSAFTAATRTGLRALPDVPAAAVEAAPRLAVSAPASFVVWRADAVAVQAPDGRVAAWSTDTRAGTPLLPALEEDAGLPDLGGIERGVAKRERHRKALLRLVFEALGTNRLALCVDPSAAELVADLASESAQVRLLVLESRPMASKPQVGLTKSRWTVSNQHGEPVLTMEGWGMFGRRPPQAEPVA